ncbi:uncharacterized protein PAC_02438 [Phialocephala subalpina]|uniref:Zn(2)-C6 fungal-type domain-containing protein n=1 Tax=Phialocephala subalpina TaxID=576137 RepID=A0A1L7WIG8_9HELO|nr:uncharacterized protein PAC_02438 [Phialocephala subalpina]
MALFPISFCHPRSRTYQINHIIPMDRLSVPRPPPQRKRTSGKHSRNGCGTCKIRRVKCDETRPICRRCQNFKITCDGYSRPPGLANQSALAGGLRIAPRPVMTPSIPSNPSTMVIDNEMDHQYFAFFRDQLSFRMTPFAQSDPFRELVLQASTIPSIRHTTIALAALAKTYSTLQEAGSPFRAVIPEVNAHSEYSLQQYSKGLGLMKHDVADGRQDLRTTILTCLLIICVECFHGNYAMVGTVLSNAMSLLRDWTDRSVNAASHPLGFSSPDPHTIEDSLVQIIGGLELQSFTFDAKASQKQHAKGMDEGFHVVRNMPTVFQSVEESRLYLELITRRMKHWLYYLGSFFRPLISVDDEVGSPGRRDSTASYDSDASSIYSVDDNVKYPGNEPVEIRQALYLGELDQWKASWQSFVATSSAMGNSFRLKEQLLAYKSVALVLKTIVVGDEMVFDEYTDEMVDVLDITEEVIAGLMERRDPTTFIIFHRSTNPAHYMALHCRVPDIRRRAVKILRSLQGTQTLSDSLFVAQIAEYVIEIEEAEMVDGQIPGYARVRQVGVSVNVNEKEARLSCPHQVMTPTGPVDRVEKKTIPF